MERVTTRPRWKEVAHAQDRIFHVMAAADQDAQPRQQLFKLERLGQVIVGPGIQAQDLVVDGVARRQDEHVRLEPRLAPVAQERHAVDLGEHQVENDDVVAGGAGLVVALLAVLGGVDGEAFFFQAAAQGLCQRLVIFDQQDSHARSLPHPILDHSTCELKVDERWRNEPRLRIRIRSAAKTAAPLEFSRGRNNLIC
jgi:hypothetical protein